MPVTAMNGGPPRVGPDGRRRAMQANHGRTRPERRLASAIWGRGFRFFTPVGYRSRTGSRLIGSPDLIFPRKRLVVFLDGCFWHGCPACKGIPTQSGEYWRLKITRNVARDAEVTAELESDGWRVLRVWEHEVKNHASLDATVDAFEKALV